MLVLASVYDAELEVVKATFVALSSPASRHLCNAPAIKSDLASIVPVFPEAPPGAPCPEFVVLALIKRVFPSESVALIVYSESYAPSLIKIMPRLTWSRSYIPVPPDVVVFNAGVISLFAINV